MKHLRAARKWLASRGFDPTLLAELTDREVTYYVATMFPGGWHAFTHRRRDRYSGIDPTQSHVRIIRKVGR